MKKVILGFTAIFLTAFFSCKTSQKASGTQTEFMLGGAWVLSYISGPKMAIEGLYPDRKPEITFNPVEKRVSGNAGCNNFNGSYKAEGNKIDLKRPFTMTRMMCEGQGESLFMETLRKITTFEADEATLTLMMGDIAVMRFVKKTL